MEDPAQLKRIAILYLMVLVEMPKLLRPVAEISSLEFIHLKVKYS
jgi:hypothetical protein